MKMTPRQRDRWAKTRQMGRGRFVWLYGVAAWGLTTGVVWSIWMAYTQGWNFLPLYLVLALVLFPVGGYFFGQWVWTTSEKKFEQSE